MRKGWPLLAGAVVLCGAATWLVRQRSAVVHNLTSPAYWEDRLTGANLYRADEAILKHGNPNLPEIALTFDDGPHPASLGKILESLHAYGIRATFFLVGKRIDEHPDWVRRIVESGHEVGNHTQDHLRLTSLSDLDARREIDECERAFEQATGRGMTLLRPPGMRSNPRLYELTKRLGYTTIGWTDAAKDFESLSNRIENLTTDEIANRVLQRVGNGSIILLHDTPQTAQALPRIISLLRVSGYKFVTVPEMLAHLPHPVVVRHNGGPHFNARLSAGVSR